MGICCIKKGYPIYTDRLDSWWRALDDGSILFFSGVPGLGKTVSAKALAGARENYRLTYISYMDEAMRARLDQFFDDVREENVGADHLLIVDDLLFYGEDDAERWLEHTFFLSDALPAGVKVVLISSMAVPANLKKYVFDHSIYAVGADTLFLDEQAIYTMLKADRWAKEQADLIVKARARECYRLTGGYPLAVLSYINGMTKENPSLEALEWYIEKDVVDVLASRSAEASTYETDNG